MFAILGKEDKIVIDEFRQGEKDENKKVWTSLWCCLLWLEFEPVCSSS